MPSADAVEQHFSVRGYLETFGYRLPGPVCFGGRICLQRLVAGIMEEKTNELPINFFLVIAASNQPSAPEPLAGKPQRPPNTPTMDPAPGPKQRISGFEFHLNRQGMLSC
jgi:hypothetical protein